MTLFHDISAFPITPTDTDGTVDVDGVGRLAAHLASSDVGSIGLLGSTGAYAYLTRTERRRAVAATVEAVGGKVPIMVGVGALRTDEACLLAVDAEAEGADGLLMAPMSYTPLTQDEVYEHYVAVSRTTGLPMCVYNNPGTTHFTFGAPLLERLAALPEIAAVKMPLPGTCTVKAELAELRAGPMGALAIGYSGDRGLIEALSGGADAFYSVLAGFLPGLTVRLSRLVAAGRMKEISQVERQLQPLLELFKDLGGIRVAYAAASELHLADAEPPRPILSFSSEDRQRIAEALDALRTAP